jgi:hypothetical protein
MRWTIIGDGEGRRYLCPADRAQEARRMLEAVVSFWTNGTVSSSDRGIRMPPPTPDFIVLLEGEELTFERPLINGREPAG